MLKDKIALVSGATRGIGQAIAIMLGKNGATVIGTATSESGATSISNYLKENDIKGTGAVLNVTSASSVAEIFKFAKANFGGVAILVNNAGITKDNLLLRMSEEDWHSIVDTNLGSVYRMSKACLRDMMKARVGRIINISSVVAFSGNPGQVNYSATKAGMIGFTKSLAREVASRNITVNCVAPGFIETDMTKALPEAQQDELKSAVPLNRLGSCDDVAAVVNFLASDAATYITGETIHVNGGMYMA